MSCQGRICAEQHGHSCVELDSDTEEKPSDCVSRKILRVTMWKATRSDFEEDTESEIKSKVEVEIQHFIPS